MASAGFDKKGAAGLGSLSTPSLSGTNKEGIVGRPGSAASGNGIGDSAGSSLGGGGGGGDGGAGGVVSSGTGMRRGSSATGAWEFPGDSIGNSSAGTTLFLREVIEVVVEEESLRGIGLRLIECVCDGSR